MTTPPERIILGVDPGTVVMGYGIIHTKGQKISLEVAGVLKLNQHTNHYMRLKQIHERILALIDEYLPDEFAVEAPFYGKNVQSMLKLGRAQGVAMAAALVRDIPITEYVPMRIKQAITGNGRASKEQVAGMVERLLNIKDGDIPPEFDATDALAVAICHAFLTSNTALQTAGATKTWKEFVEKNPNRIKK